MAMTRTPQPRPKAAASEPERPPVRWGTSSATFYARLEDECVLVYFLEAADAPLCGRLVGVDQYDIFLEVEGVTWLIAKHAIRSVRPNVSTETIAAQ